MIDRQSTMFIIRDNYLDLTLNKKIIFDFEILKFCNLLVDLRDHTAPNFKAPPKNCI